MRVGERTRRQQEADRKAAIRGTLRYRKAKVLSLNPLKVAPGGAGSVEAALQQGAIVAVNDYVDCVETQGILLVLGRSSTTSPAWTNASWSSGWGGDVKYRIVGETLQFKGTATRSSNTITYAFTLPPEARPPADATIACLIFGAVGYVTVEAANGRVTFKNVAATVQTTGVLDGVFLPLT